MGLSTSTVISARSKNLGVLAGELVSIQQQSGLAEQIRKATRDAEALLLGRDRSDLAVRLKPASWSVAECLDHLTQTTKAFLPAISAAILAAPRLTRNRRLRTGIIPSLFIWNLNPPYRIRFQVLPQLAPQDPDFDTAWTSFVDSQRQLLDALCCAAGLAIDKVNIKSPVYARISYNLFGAFRMLAAHQSRHIWQIQQILKALDRRASRVA